MTLGLDSAFYSVLVLENQKPSSYFVLISVFLMFFNRARLKRKRLWQFCRRSQYATHLHEQNGGVKRWSAAWVDLCGSDRLSPWGTYPTGPWSLWWQATTRTTRPSCGTPRAWWRTRWRASTTSALWAAAAEVRPETLRSLDAGTVQRELLRSVVWISGRTPFMATT